MKTLLKSLVVAGLGLFGTAGIVEAATPWHSASDSYGIAAGGCYGPNYGSNDSYARSYADPYHRFDRSRDAYDTAWNQPSSNRWSHHDRWTDSRWTDTSWNNDRYGTSFCSDGDDRVSFRYDRSRDSWSHGDSYRDRSTSWNSRYDRYDGRYDDRTRRSHLFEPWSPSR